MSSAVRGRLVQMPVPPVRPLLRRTIKRFLRLLPSVLLLLFVISLIFVTLMQIAVIHTHRRTLALQRAGITQTNSMSSSIATNSTLNANQLEAKLLTSTTVSSKVPIKQLESESSPVPSIAKKIEVLRIEALLDKNLPSVEANTKTLQNYINSGRIKQIIRFAHNHNVSQTLVYKTQPIVNSTNESALQTTSDIADTYDTSVAANESAKVRYQSLRDDSLNYTDENDAQFAINSAVRVNYNNSYVKHKTKLNSNHNFITLSNAKSMCPSVPPKLIGRVRVEPHIRIDSNMSQIIKLNGDLQFGGFWEPTDCYARHRVAVIIPYRDRMEHLAILLYHLHPILKRQLLFYKIYVIEQFGSDTFNKGVLMNAGVREALKENNYHCFVFHDVDLIPEDDRNLYSCPFAPRHMSVAVDKFNYSLPYKDLVGGVLSISKANFVLVNGYSNLYWGWGGEDDDLAHRLKYHNLHIIRPPESIGRYTMIKHHHRPESPNNVRSALLRMAKRRALRDGLGSVRYKVIFKHYERCFTHIMVEIGHIHKWHFPSPNKLVLHFR